MLTAASRVIFLSIALIAIVACAADSAHSTITVNDTPAAAPTPTATPEPIIGIRGAAQLGNPVFPSFGNGGYDVSRYDLDLIIDPGANTLTGVATIRVKVTANLAAFNFDFVGPKVSEVRVNGEPAILTRAEN